MNRKRSINNRHNKTEKVKSNMRSLIIFSWMIHSVTSLSSTSSNSILWPPTQIPNHFFDSLTLSNLPCEDGYVTSNDDSDYLCICSSKGYLRTQESCSEEELRTGSSCLGFTCSNECADAQEASDHVSGSCISCDNPKNATTLQLQLQPSFDTQQGDCTCNNPLPILGGTKVLRSKQFVPLYDGDDNHDDDVSISRIIGYECRSCPPGTAVLSQSVMNSLVNEDTTEDAITTVIAGKEYFVDPSACAYCPDAINMVFLADYSCTCRDGYVMVGEESVGDKKCIKMLPSINTGYHDIKFPIIGEVISTSLIHSHIYLDAASHCEYFKWYSKRSRAGCQSLANLCTLQLYDNEAAACTEYKLIEEFRNNFVSITYEGQRPLMLPWLFYESDAIQDLMNGRKTLPAKISFGDKVEIKLGKYSLSGKFQGFQDFLDLFKNCSSQAKADDVIKFGYNKVMYFHCSFDVMQNVYLFDPFIVDSTKSSCSEITTTDCLYPVPVIHRNTIFNGNLLNWNLYSNKQAGQDRIYTRRFFLADLKSGNNQVVRVAKKIMLEIVMDEDTMKIRPPTIIIEYDEVRINAEDLPSFEVQVLLDFSKSNGDFIVVNKVVLSILAMISFLIILVFVRSHYICSIGRSLENAIQFDDVVKCCQITCKTFVFVIGGYFTLLCTFMLSFYKLQNHPLVLFSSRRDEFFGRLSSNWDHNFFIALIYSLFFAQSLNIIALLYLQYKTEVYFIDFENPRNDLSNISAWRLIMVSNVWRNLETSRSVGIEFNLILMIVLLVGMDLQGVATSQPDINILSTEFHEISKPLCFANNCWYWFFLTFIQLLWKYFIYERYWKEPKSQMFLDLCSMANISVLIRDQILHGYFIHCQSQYSFADSTITELTRRLNANEPVNVKRDISRNELKNGRPYEIIMSHEFAEQFEKVQAISRKTNTLPLRNFECDLQSCNVDGKNNMEMHDRNKNDKQKVNRFIVSFVKRSSNLKYACYQHKSMCNRILGLAPIKNGRLDSTIFLPVSTALNASTFGSSFLSSSTLYGIDLDLTIHDILVYNAVYFLFEGSDFTPSSISTIAAAITYGIHLLRKETRSLFFTGKNCVDERLILF